MTTTSQEEYDMIGQIDRKVLNLLYDKGEISLGDIQQILVNSDLELNADEVISYSKVLVFELQKRFLENVEVPLFSINSDNVRFVIHEEAHWVLDQISQEVYDENGEVVAKVLPNFEMEEYQ